MLALHARLDTADDLRAPFQRLLHISRSLSPCKSLEKHPRVGANLEIGQGVRIVSVTRRS